MMNISAVFAALIFGAGLASGVFGFAGHAQAQTQTPDLESLTTEGPLTQPRLNSLMLAPGQEADARKLFDLMDNNGDGRISRQEFNLKRMDAFFIRDANNDGKLSRDEIPGISDELFAATDKDGDGFISALEFNQAEWLTFESFDTNGDGFIDLEEFLGRGAELE